MPRSSSASAQKKPDLWPGYERRDPVVQDADTLQRFQSDSIEGESHSVNQVFSICLTKCFQCNRDHKTG